MPEIVGDHAVLFYKQTNTYVPIVRQKKKIRADDWCAKTAYKVNGEQDAKRKAANDNSQLIVIEESAAGTE